MDTTGSTNSTGNVPLSPILKTALATVSKTTTNNGEADTTHDDSDKLFPEDRVSKD